MAMEEKINYFAETDYRNKKTRFGIKERDRARHMYIIGKTGMGKSTLEENMAIQDIQNGAGVAIIDPHGGFAEKMLDYVPEHRIGDVIYFAPFDLENPIAFNVMENIGADKRHLVAAGLMSTFKKQWVDAWSARMEYMLNNTILALLEYPGATLMGVNKMLSDKEFRKKVVANITDHSVKSFWVDEFANYTERMAAEAVPAIQNKIGQFTANPLIRNIIGQEKSSFDIREVMDTKKILIMNLSKGRIGEQNAALLGGMLITKIYLAAMSRADLPEEELAKKPSFYFYVDEFQSFASDSFANILSEARKYKLSLTIAHQYVEQMTDEVKAAVFGNVGTMVIFRVGSTDAEIFEKEFAPVFTAEDIVSLGFAQIYLRLMIGGVGSKPFSAVTMGPLPKPEISYKEQVLENSRKVFANPREEVEKMLQNWHDENTEKPKEKAPKKDGYSGGQGGQRDYGNQGPRDYNNQGPRDYNQQNRGQYGSNQGQGGPQRTNTPGGFQPALKRPFEKAFTEEIPVVRPPVPVPAAATPPAPPQSPRTVPTSEVALKRQEPVVTQNQKPPVSSTPPRVPSGPSPMLKNLLSQLEKEDSTIASIDKKMDAAKPTPQSSPVVQKQAPISLDLLKQPIVSKTKDPSERNMSSLKETLARALEKQNNSSPASPVPTPAPKPAPKPAPQPVVEILQKMPNISNPQQESVQEKPVIVQSVQPNEPVKQETVSSAPVQKSVQSDPVVVPKKPKEVPEDVLRKILE